jgi:DNA-binding PadR family transcriptional regulator
MRISDAEINMLGIINKGAKYGYEIEKFIEKEDMREWTSIGFSSIYYILNKLEKKKLVESKSIITSDNKARKNYELTEAGLSSLRENVIRTLSEPDDVVFPFDMALYHRDVIDISKQKECINKLISKFKSDLIRAQKCYDDVESKIDKLIMQREITFYNSEIEFLYDILNELGKN